MAATVRRCRRRLVNLARAPTRHASGSTQRLLSCGAFGAQLPPASSATSSSSRAFSSAAARAFFKLNDLAKIAGDIRPLGSSGSESITQYQDTRTLRRVMTLDRLSRPKSGRTIYLSTDLTPPPFTSQIYFSRTLRHRGRRQFIFRVPAALHLVESSRACAHGDL